MLYQSFGKPEIFAKNVKSKDAGLIWVCIKFPQQPVNNLYFKYERALSEEMRCKIITETSYEDKLVCEV